MKHLLIPVLLILIQSSAYSIELVIDGKSYEIDRYRIEENGQKIVIPNINERTRKPSSYNSLIQDLEDGFKSLDRDLTDPKKLNGESKRNYR